MREKRFSRVPAVAVLLLVGLGARLFALQVQPLWWDEGYSLFFATESPARLIELTSLDIHPPLYYLLLQAWLAVVGIGEAQARWFSVLLGVLTLPVAWWVARPLAGKRAAWLSTLLLALSPLHVYYSQEVRMYGLVTLLALLATGFWQRRLWWALGVAVAAGLLTHYYFAFLPLALALLILWEWRAGRYSLAGPLRALLVAAAGFLPWALYAGPRLLTYVGNKLAIEADQPMTPLEFLPRHLIAWSTGHLSPGWEWVAVGTLLFVALALLPFARQRRRGGGGGRAAFPLLVLWGVPTLGAFLVGLSAPFVDPRIERQLLYVQPFFLMAVARGFGLLWRRWSLATAPFLLGLVGFSLVALWGFYTVPRYPGEDYRPLLAHVGAEQGPGDAWLAVYPWQIGYLRAYLPEHHPSPVQAEIGWDEEPAALEAGLSSLLADHPRLWFPAYQVKGRIFEESIAEALRGQGVEAWNEWYGNSRLFLVGRAPEPPALSPLGTFAEAGEVRGALAVDGAPSGVGILPVFIEMAPGVEGLRVSIQLVGSGEVWGEWDGTPRDGLVRAGVPVAHGTPPGAYSVQLALYRSGNGQPLDRFENGERRTPDVTLGAVTIGRPSVPLPAVALSRLTTDAREALLGGTVRFLGAAGTSASWQQGDALPLTLFWQAERAPGQELIVFVQAIGMDGVVRAARESAPVNGAFPTSAWQSGDLVRDPHDLLLPADMPAGRYQLRAGLYAPVTSSRLAGPDGQDSILLGMIEVQERVRLMEGPGLGEPVDVSFGNRARLARVKAPALEQGLPLDITLVWHSETTGGSALRTFVQLYRDGTQLDSSDHVLDPPATAWIEGEWIVDAHFLEPVDPLAPGEYRLVAGLYDPATGTRLTTSEGEWATIAQWIVED